MAPNLLLTKESATKGGTRVWLVRAQRPSPNTLTSVPPQPRPKLPSSDSVALLLTAASTACLPVNPFSS